MTRTAPVDKKEPGPRPEPRCDTPKRPRLVREIAGRVQAHGRIERRLIQFRDLHDIVQDEAEVIPGTAGEPCVRAAQLGIREIHTHDGALCPVRYPLGKCTAAGGKFENTVRPCTPDCLKVVVVRAFQGSVETLRIVAGTENGQMEELAPVVVVDVRGRGEDQRHQLTVVLPPRLRGRPHLRTVGRVLDDRILRTIHRLLLCGKPGW